MRSSGFGHHVTLVATLAIPLALSAGSPLSAAEPSPGSPACEEFFDKWEAPGVPPAMLAIAGVGRELMAAMDCVQKNDIPRACAHWRKLIEVTDKLGPPLSDNRVGIETQMREHKCDSVAAPDGK